MKIIIAPSKTMVETEKNGSTTPLFKKKTNELLTHIQEFSMADLAAFFSVNDAIAKENYERFQHFDPSHEAIFAYTGFQFKHLKAHQLDQQARDYLDEHLCIMSGLYGLVRPTDTIGLYRLPMGLKIKALFLKDHWKPVLSRHLKGQTVVNLASKEYSDAIDQSHVRIVDVFFKIDTDGTLKSPAMENKKMRGKMVRFMAKKQVKSPEELTEFTEEGYRFNPRLSTEDRFVFIKTKAR